MFLKTLFLLPAALAALQAQEVRAIVPTNGVPLIGPYSPGVLAGNYLYVSGQGAKQPNGQMPNTFEGQVRQTLENVKTVVEAAGLTMRNVVYTQVYLSDMTQFEAMNRTYAEYFRDTPPARATLGVAKLPGGTPIEVNAVAFRNVSEIKAISLNSRASDEPLSPGILTPDLLFISGMRGHSEDSGKQVDSALDGMKAVVEAAGLKLANIVFVNPYLTSKIPTEKMNSLYAKHFEFGNTPARATIEVTSLPEDTQIEFTGVAVKDLQKRVAVRPKNMPPSPTASPCVFAGDILYCSAKSGFIPGSNGGIFSPDPGLQLRQTMRNLLDNLEDADLTFNDVVSANVYLDDLADFGLMNTIYARYFSAIHPARTTIQQVASINRNKSADDKFPGVEQISLVAVRRRGR